MNANQNLPVPVTPPAIIHTTSVEPQSRFKIRIDSTSGVHIDEHDYVKHKKLPNGYLLARLDIPDIIREFSFEELEELRQADRLSVTHEYHSSRSAAGRLNSGITYLSDLPGARQTAWSDRLEIVEDFIVAERDGEYSRSDKSLKKFIKNWFSDRVESSTGRFGKSFDIDSPPSPTSLRRWLRSFEACDHDPAALIDGYGRSGNLRPATSCGTSSARSSNVALAIRACGSPVSTTSPRRCSTPAATFATSTHWCVWTLRTSAASR